MPALEGAPQTISDVTKGDWVVLLQPHLNGLVLLPRDSVTRWWNDDAPDPRNVALPTRGGHSPECFVDASSGQPISPPPL